MKARVIFQIAIVILFNTFLVKAQKIDWAIEAIGSGIAYTGSLSVSDDGTAVISGHNNIVGKYDSDGNLAWTVEFESEKYNNVRPTGALIDKNGNVFFSGYFRESISVQGKTTTSHGLADIFIAKFNKDGKIQWLKNGGSTSGDFCYQIENDDSGNLYISATCKLPFYYGNKTIQKSKTQNFNSILLKLDSSGDLVWSKTGFATFCPQIEVTGHGELFFFGQYQNWLLWGKDSLMSKGGPDVYIGKLSKGGENQWLTTITSPYYDFNNDFCLDKNDNPVLLIQTLDDFQVNDSVITADSSIKYAVVSLNKIGELNWVKLLSSEKYKYNFQKIIQKPDGSLNIFSAIMYNYHSKGLIDICIDIHNGTIIDTFVLDIWINPQNFKTDLLGNLYLYGTFSNSIKFENQTIYSTKGSSSSYYAKINFEFLIKKEIESFNVYPNPFNSEIIIETQENAKLPEIYFIYDMYGHLLKTGTIKDVKTRISLDDLRSGMYLFMLNDSAVKITKY